MARNSQNSRSTNRKSTNGGSFGGVMDMARERPVAAAAAAAGAVAASVFLWSKRSQISDQLSHLSEQISEWTDTVSSDKGESDLAAVVADSSTVRRSRGSAGKGRRTANSGNTLSGANSGSPVA
jgi:hypothetical protein